MPVDYTIDQAQGWVHVTYRGIITDQELVTSIERLHADPAHQIGMPTLVDFEPVERLEVSAGALRATADMEETTVDRIGRPWAVAIVAPNDDAYRVACLYRKLREASPEHVGVFRDEEDARRWLGLIADSVSSQIGMSLRFLDRLGSLTPEARAGIRLPEDPIEYVEAVRMVRAAIETEPAGGDLKRLADFATRADRQLDDLGVTDDLGAMAKEAVRSIIVWPQPDVRGACQVVYQPFEGTIHFAVLI